MIGHGSPVDLPGLYTHAYIDPNLYIPGREITVAGEFKGTTLILTENEEPIKYSYPVSKELKLSPNKQEPEEPNWWNPLWNPLSPMLTPLQ
jgi:hypothetical protein